jgi:NAD(P)-dependent dehydrogenase (short-subunit alcohol dehydrogenase family)
VAEFDDLGSAVSKMFKSKVVVVTGSSVGIGAGTAIKYAKEGAAVIVLHGRQEQALNKVRDQIKAVGREQGVKVHIVVGDVTDPKVQDKLTNGVVELFGQLDVLVNNAAVIMQPQPTSTAPIAEYDRLMNINVRSVIQINQLAIPHLIKTKGNIVNISSIASLRSRPIFTYYAMSKIALDHYTRCMAVELGPQGVRVNTINPGYIGDTELSTRQGATPEMMKQFEQQTTATYPLRRGGKVEEVANLITFLSSDAAGFITGDIIPIDGGAILG